MEQPLPAPDSDLYLSYRLQPDETLAEPVEEVKITLPERHLSVIDAVTTLTNVRRLPNIGYDGTPPNAAVTRPEDRGDHDLDKFNHLFPRDAHVMSGFVFEYHPHLTRMTVTASLEKMGIKNNYDNPQGDLDEQEVGKVPHELLDPNHPTAIDLTKRKQWGWPYYGAIDTTGKNVIAINRLVGHKDFGLDFLDKEYVGRDGQTHTVLHGLEQNIAWITKRMGRNDEGLVECLDKNPLHHANQTWADSPESFHHADGSWAEYHTEHNLGVASVEVQAETYDALKAAAGIYEKLGRFTESIELHEKAERLRAVVLDKFWVQDENHAGGFFARGTDRDADRNLRPLAIRSSDMGHLLNSGILDDTDDPLLNEEIRYKREAVIQNLFSEEMLCPSGIRTLSTDSVRYSDIRYHNGTSWPWTSFFIAQGLDRHGFHNLSDELKKRVWDNYNETKMFGEYASGSADPTLRIVTQKIKVHNETLLNEKEYHISRPAQIIQGWTAMAIYAMKREYAKRVTAQKLTRNRTLGNLYLTAAQKGYIDPQAIDERKRAFESPILESIV